MKNSSGTPYTPYAMAIRLPEGLAHATSRTRKADPPDKPETDDKHQRAEELARDHDHGDGRRLEPEAQEDHSGPDHEVDRDLSERIGKRGPYGTEPAGPARAEGESPQIGRQLARGSRPNEAEEEGAERRNVEGVVPTLDREDGSLGQLAQPAVPGDDEVTHLTSLGFRPWGR